MRADIYPHSPIPFFWRTELATDTACAAPVYWRIFKSDTPDDSGDTMRDLNKVLLLPQIIDCSVTLDRQELLHPLGRLPSAHGTLIVCEAVQLLNTY